MKKLSYLFVFLIFVAVIALAGGYFWYNDATTKPASTSAETVSLTVAEGDSFSSILPVLESQGLIRSTVATRIYLQVNNLSPQLKVGNYQVPQNLNLEELIRLLEKGTIKESISVTIKEGQSLTFTAETIAEKMQNSSFSKEEFINIVENPDVFTFDTEVQEFLNTHKPSGANLLGYIYPDTYFFDTDMTSQMVVQFMITNLIDKLEANGLLPFTGSANGEVTTLHEALTLASIIEREASGRDDRKLISGILHNRLEDDYLLQADSTVNFITGKNDAGVLIADTLIDNPYNTYKYAGLPPGPINNPRIESIVAAARPSETEYYYFIHDPEGNSYFARTLLEHESNIANYL